MAPPPAYSENSNLLSFVVIDKQIKNQKTSTTVKEIMI